MSKTRKGNRKSGADNYPTPVWPIERFLEEWPDLLEVGKKWLEPCIGDGVIVDVVNRFKGGVEWTACDIRDVRPALRKRGFAGELFIGDFFELDRFNPETHRKEFDVAILNPPFRLGMEFIKACLRMCHVTVLLQRINYCGSANRNGFFRKSTPDLYVIPDRISFTGDGQADSLEHAWHVWGPHPRVGVGEYRVLRTTSDDVRRVHRRRVVEARDEISRILDAIFFDHDHHDHHVAGDAA